ncbi:MAG: metal-dependent hydrolase [Candidatus Bipolaricaulaceae bacterium]
MRLRTHVLASPAFVVFGALAAGRPAPPWALAFAALGAALPEVDKADSIVGRLCPFSAWLEERFGHRGPTHSLLGLTLVAGAFAPLVLWHFWAWLALVIGYLSHLLLDMATLEGIPLLWPRDTRHVFPGRDDLRLDQADPRSERKEIALTGAMVILAAALWPLSEAGLPSVLRRALGTLPEALTEYQRLAGEHEVFLGGTFLDAVSGQRVEGEWLVVADYQGGFLVREGARVRYVAENGNLKPIRVRLRSGQPVQVLTSYVRFTGPLAQLWAYVDPAKEHYISGTVRLTTPKELTFAPTEFATVRGSSEWTLTMATLAQIPQDLQGLIAEHAELVVVHRLRPGESLRFAPPPAGPLAAAQPVEVRFSVASMSELYVQEGQEVQEGDLLGRRISAALEAKRAEVELARERFELGLVSAVELRKLEAELAMLERQHEVRALLSGHVQSVRIESVTDEVKVVLTVVPRTAASAASAPLPEILAIYQTLPELPPTHGELAWVLRAVDGDTLELNYQGQKRNTRLVGVDTPETKDPRKPVQCYGPEAARYTSTTLPKGTEVRLTYNPLGDRQDKYGRLLVYLWVQLDSDEPFELFNAALVRLGYARVYPFFPFDRLEEFRKLEAAARQERRGLWASCGYEPYK